MSAQHALQQVLHTPNVLGYVLCGADGQVVARDGRETDALTGVLVHFTRVAGQFGQRFGLDSFHEAQIHGKPLTVLCLPWQGGALGVVLDSRARLAEVALTVRRAMDGE
ncbi:roadblock/LC7 domain-containing protein [Pseudothauera lacus]|uniref:Roadblock/LAMTOR2 domain-containing protein n=1 Tax=Pseudothauera lacus TaxID=2136175 RepID=A0A2T4IHS8_9RHOO|nr:roadblock/LC7 domain-containing protein [Pseudothauera lacus]PTD97276.1 hypothetical protein C8261_04490 [Pseudothauera lacus]